MDVGSLSLTDRKIIVGIDFGTTYSGICWAESRKPEHNTVIESWPSSQTSLEGTSSAKVPTQLRYTPGGVEWGFQIPPLVERHEWFKLGLENPPQVTDAKTDPKALTTAYLSCLNKHLVYMLEQSLGAGILRTTPLKFVLTVPAIWKESAKEKTLAACKMAGLNTKTAVTLVSEPEAAAIYALHSLDPHGLKVGESFVLCDAGGGTVDLISYTVTAIYPKLQIKEAAEGSGGLCGSTFLNRRFSEYLKGKLSKEPGWDDEILADAVDSFENVIKRQYSATASSADGYSILVPGLANNERLGIRRGRMSIRAADMRDIFEPVVQKVIALVNGQIRATRKPISAVLLVGGFGQSAYLKERLRAALGAGGSATEVKQPANSWTAVVRGAVMMGLAGNDAAAARVNLQSRVARKHYGLNLSVPFVAGQHSESEKYFSDSDKIWRVNVMHWFIKKGQTVTEGKPTDFEFIEPFEVSNGYPESSTLQIYADSVSATAPVHKNDNVGQLGALTADLSGIPRAEVKKTVKRYADGKSYYELRGSVEATFGSAATKYVLLFQGRRYDVVTAEYA